MKRHIATSNLAIYKPRKDQCDTCTAYNAGNVDEKEYQEHIMNKEEAMAEKKRNELAEKDDAVIVLYIDIQKVLLSPSFQTSACYYKSKLCSHNYTIYDKKSKEATCYVWNESEGDLSSNTFSSFIIDYISHNEKCMNSNHIIHYTDGCNYQNRCVQLSNTLLYYSILSGK